MRIREGRSSDLYSISRCIVYRRCTYYSTCTGIHASFDFLCRYQQIGEQEEEEEDEKERGVVDNEKGVVVVVNSFLGALVTMHVEKRPGKEKESLLQEDQSTAGEVNTEDEAAGLFGSITK